MGRPPLLVTTLLLALCFLAAPLHAQTETPPTEPVPASDDAETPPAEPASPDPAPDGQPAAPVEPGAAEQPPAEAGLAAFDKATELKLSAEGLRDLNRVIDLLDEALEAGLNEGNREFAEEMLIATLMQRAESMAGAVLDRPIVDPRRDPRWIQVRQFALTDLQRAVSIDDSLVEAHLLIGRLQSLPLGDPNAARRALTEAIKKGADSLTPEQLSQAYALRGATQKDAEKQLADFSKAVEIAPDNAEFHRARARSYFVQQDFEAALADAERAAELAPKDQRVYELKGLILRALERPEDAIAALDKATEIAPKALRPYQLRAELHTQLGDFDSAVAEVDAAMAQTPGSLELLLLRAEIYRLAERYEEALADIESLLEQRPRFVDGQLLRAALLDRLGRGDLALDALEQLAANNPNEPKVQLQLAGVYLGAERLTDAIETLTRVIDATDDNATALRLRGDTYLSIGKHVEALADFKQAYTMIPNDSGLLNNYAWTLATSPFDELRDGGRAVELATTACELTEYEAPHILSTLAAAYAESGDFEKAVEWSQKAVAMHAADTGKARDMTEELAAELASYESGNPWRELQQQGGGQPSGGDAEEGIETDPATPVETLDF